MASFIDFAFQEEYQRVKRLGDKLAEIDSLIDWEAFRSINFADVLRFMMRQKRDDRYTRRE